MLNIFFIIFLFSLFADRSKGVKISSNVSFAFVSPIVVDDWPQSSFSFAAVEFETDGGGGGGGGGGGEERRSSSPATESSDLEPN